MNPKISLLRRISHFCQVAANTITPNIVACESVAGYGVVWGICGKLEMPKRTDGIGVIAAAMKV
jgi:hypothetical protein